MIDSGGCIPSPSCGQGVRSPLPVTGLSILMGEHDRRHRPVPFGDDVYPRPICVTVHAEQGVRGLAPLFGCYRLVVQFPIILAEVSPVPDQMAFQRFLHESEESEVPAPPVLHTPGADDLPRSEQHLRPPPSAGTLSPPTVW